MDGSKPYHHGDLRVALLDAAEAELEATGLEAFSLRKVAKRAGVSHAAPAHHFGDVAGLLTALAARGYERLMDLCNQRDSASDGSDRGRLMGYGLAYCDFAREHQALFRLCFASIKPDHGDPNLAEVGDKAFLRLVDRVCACDGSTPEWTAKGMERVYLCWALSHGIADLLASGRLKFISEMTPEARDTAILGLLDAGMPELLG